MIRKTLLECEFLIPIRQDRDLSDGDLHATSAWAWLESELLDFDGITRSTALYEGWYRERETGNVVQDLSRKYALALPRSKLRHLRALLRRACEVSKQKCVYLSVAGQVEFVEGTSDE